MSKFEKILYDPGLLNCVVKRIFSYLPPYELVKVCLINQRCEEILFELYEPRTLFALVCQNHDQNQGLIIEKILKNCGISDARIGLETLLSDVKSPRKSVQLIFDAYPQLKRELYLQKSISVKCQNGFEMLKSLCEKKDGFYHQGNLTRRILVLLKSDGISGITNFRAGTAEGHKFVVPILLHLSIRTKNRDAIIALFLGIDRISVTSKLLWGKILFTLVRCTPKDRCQDHGRNEKIRKVLKYLNRYNYKLVKTPLPHVKCLQMKYLLKSWVNNPKEVRGTKRKYQCTV